MSYLIICSVALIASGLTFFSGFGLGTLLFPAFAVFFAVERAVALTAVVHFLNGLFKLFLLWRHIDRAVVVRFGALADRGRAGGRVEPALDCRGATLAELFALRTHHGNNTGEACRGSAPALFRLRRTPTVAS
jgi:hypothetical protein